MAVRWNMALSRCVRIKHGTTYQQCNAGVHLWDDIQTSAAALDNLVNQISDMAEIGSGLETREDLSDLSERKGVGQENTVTDPCFNEIARIGELHPNMADHSLVLGSVLFRWEIFNLQFPHDFLIDVM